MNRVLSGLLVGVLISSLALVTSAETSEDWSGFYDRRTLAQAADDLRPGILDNWHDVIVPVLTPKERSRLGQVRFLVDLESADSILNFFATSSEVHIPASSVRMLGDLVAAWMWLNRRGYSTDTVSEYLAILKYQWTSGALRTQRYRPLEALGVPADLRSDPTIADEYANVMSNILFFIIAHELGHVFYGHQGIRVQDAVQDAMKSEQSIKQEKEADAFALELTQRIGEVPIGIPMFFMFATALEPAPNDPGYGNRRTHPQSSERIRAIATTLRSEARGFARGFKDPSVGIAKVEAIANWLVNKDSNKSSVVAALESPVVQDLWRQKGYSGRLEDVRPRKKSDPASLETAPRANSGQVFDGVYQGKWVNQKGTDFDVRMELQRTGDRVVGSWTFGPNRVAIEGIISDGHLYFSWKWGVDYFGEGELYQQRDGRLAGTWGYTKKASGGGTWSLHRP